MARGRMISKSLSTSEKFARVFDIAGNLAEFCHSLYPLLVAHSDDFGRQQGDVHTVKLEVHPASHRSKEDFGKALQYLHDVELIVWYDAASQGKRLTASRKVIQIVEFDEHQPGLVRLNRTQSKFQAPPEGTYGFSVSEKQVQERIADDLKAGRLVIGDFTIVDVNRQVRRGSSYLDIVATTTVGAHLLIEVKRQRITNNAISQIRAYRTLLSEPVIPILIGHGVAPGTDFPVSDILIGTYGEDLKISTACEITVNSHRLTLKHVIPQLNLTQPNLTKEQTIKAAAPPPPEPSSPKPPHGKPLDNYRQILAIVHKEILPTGVTDIGDIEEATKSRCAKLRIAYNSEVVRKAVESALAARKARPA